MATFKKCPPFVKEMADAILKKHETHRPLLDAEVKIDYIFAFCDRAEDGTPKNHALTLHGTRALAIAKKIGLKDRVMGRGDAEITIDHDHWEAVGEEEQEALLDHELHHFEVKIDNRGIITDDINRPIILMRKHDVDVGWFKIVAERNGVSSIERIQAKTIADNMGQYFWPQVFNGKQLGGDTVTLSAAGKSVTMTGEEFKQLPNRLRKLKK